jgi:HK97 family phage major capsid protein
VVDPLGWAQLRKLKTGTDYNSTLLGAGTDDAQPRLFGIPVTVSVGMDDYTVVIIDSTSIAVASSEVDVAVSEHALFASNGILLRAGWRFGWNVVRPERLGVFSIVQPGS